jgi:hypothetical protein
LTEVQKVVHTLPIEFLYMMTANQRSNLMAYMQKLDRRQRIVTRSIEVVVWLAAIALLFQLTSCTSVKLPSGARMDAFGTDLDGVELTNDRFVASSIKNSPAFQEATKRLKQAFDAYLMYQGLVFLGGRFYDKAGAEISSAETIRLQELSNAKSAADAAEKTKQLELMMQGAP